ncbi:MAG TPA: alpha/beta hydrolase, partial [Actinomycetes bacterium]|nr:alpha/beta hydrolase [Actinomycetes bacterium]
MTLRLVRAALNGTSWVAPRVAGRATFYLFCNLKPRSKVHDSERETHHRAVLDELSVNGKKVVTYRWGNGVRPVL